MSKQVVRTALFFKSKSDPTISFQNLIQIRKLTVFKSKSCHYWLFVRQCLFCILRQKFCGSYFVFSRTRLKWSRGEDDTQAYIAWLQTVA